MSTHILTVESDEETGDLYITFPPGILEAIGWTEDDELEWTAIDNERWQLSKSEKIPL